MAKHQPFLSDIKMIRERARRSLGEGAVTESYKADREQVIELLNQALATEIVCVLRYTYHALKATGIHARSIADEFREHANEEREHAERIARRIVQLNGKPNLSPDGLHTRSHAEYVEGGSLAEMLQEDLVAERIAIDTYREIVQYLGENDPTTRRMMESILAKEEEHAEDLQTLLEDLGQKGEPGPVAPRRGRDPQSLLN